MTDSFENLWDLAMGEAFSRGGESPVRLPAADAAPAAERYTVVSPIATGGMGTVVLARDRELERDVALKMIRHEFRMNARTRSRFIREAKIAGQLQHPGVVPVYELGTDANGDIFLTMRPLGGRTLAEILTEARPAGEALMKILRNFEQVCETMAYAHSKGFIHRDLKPDNIMIGTFGEVQVLDWGLAKSLGETDVPGEMTPGPAKLSVDGVAMGTPMYMAPEQALGDTAAIDERTDVFSLGAILCEIITGEALYGDENPSTVFTRAAKGDLDPVFRRLDDSPAAPDLIALAKSCLQKAKLDRPKHAGEVAQRLNAFLSGMAERARKAEVREAASQRTRKLVTALAAAVVLMMAGGGWFAWHRMDQRREARAKGETLLAGAAVEAARENWVGAEELADRAFEAAATDRARKDRDGYRVRREERETLAKIDAVRKLGVMPPRDMDNAYVRMFQSVGIDVNALSPEEIGDRVTAMKSAVSDRLVHALDDWASRCPPQPEGPFHASWVRAMKASVRADPDAWRGRLRTAMLVGDRQAIREMAKALATTPKSPESYHLLGQGIHRSGLGYEIERDALAEGLRRHPGDFWLNFTFSHRSLEEDGDFTIAERHARIALALQPENVDVRAVLAVALYYQKKLDEAKQVAAAAVEMPAEPGPRDALKALLMILDGRQAEAEEFMSGLKAPPPPWFRSFKRGAWPKR